MFFRISVALLLSSQKPGLNESCLSSSILYRRFSTSKKTPYPGNAGPHIIQFFDCHAAKVREVCRFWFVVYSLVLREQIHFYFFGASTIISFRCEFTPCSMRYTLGVVHYSVIIELLICHLPLLIDYYVYNVTTFFIYYKLYRFSSRKIHSHSDGE